MRISFNGIACVLVAILTLCQIATAEPTAAALPAASLSAPLPTEAGHFRLRYLVNIKGKPRDLCLVVSNSKKVAETKGKVPVLIFMGGADERGTNGDLMFTHGPAAAMVRDAALNDSMPMMVVSLQFPTDLGIGTPTLGPEIVVQLKDLIAADPRVDTDRIYITGISQGGRGTWVTAAADPKAFAAIVPVAPGWVDDAKVVPLVKDLPIWIVVGEKDGAAFAKGVLPRALGMAAALKDAGSTAQLTEIMGADHSSTWPCLYANPEFYDWLLTHVRGQAPTKQYTSDELMKIATKPIDDPITAGVERDFGTFAQYWHILNCGRDFKPGLRDQVHGQKNVFAAAPLNAQMPCIMQGDFTIPAGKHGKLNLIVGQDTGSDWRMEVTANNGKELLKQKINATTTKDGWFETSIDLAPLGNNIRLQVLCYQEGDKSGPAYFAKMAIDEQ